MPDFKSRMEREPELTEEIDGSVPDAIGVRRARFPPMKKRARSSWGKWLDRHKHGCQTPIWRDSGIMRTWGEKKYSTFDRELLAMFLAVKHFRHHLEGRPFTLWTDHKPLCGAMACSTDKSPRQARHLSYVAEFSTNVRHISGRDNVVADALSRPPVLQDPDSLVDPASPPAALLPPADDEDSSTDTPTVSAITDLPRLANAPAAEHLARAQAAAPAEMAQYASNSSLKLRTFMLGQPPSPVICDVGRSGSPPRPVVPLSVVPDVFAALHSISHAGGKATLREISRRFVWMKMRSMVLRLARDCVDCQASKVSRHIRTPLLPRPPAERRFGSLHVDLVGPLPSSEGYTYIFTIIDRYTRWLEAVPLQSMTAQDCARALLRTWIARFGVPDELTSDQGRQFTSNLWKELNVSLGIHSQTTTAYHPQANGMVERTHRVLKERLMARGAASSWMDHLPLVLLGIRTSARADSNLCPAEMTFGTSLRLPGEFFAPSDHSSSGSPFIDQLRATFAALRPTPPVYHQKASAAGPSSAVPAPLQGVTHVFVRVDAVKPPLTRPYTGPFLVLAAGSKVFTLSRNGAPWKVSVDRLKPASGFDPPDAATSSVPTLPAAPAVPDIPALPVAPAAAVMDPDSTTRPPPSPGISSPSSVPALPTYSNVCSRGVTRFGRVLRVPERYQS